MRISRTEKGNFTAISNFKHSDDVPKDLKKLAKRTSDMLKEIGGDNVTHEIQADFNAIAINSTIKGKNGPSLFETSRKALEHQFKTRLNAYIALVKKADI